MRHLVLAAAASGALLIASSAHAAQTTAVLTCDLQFSAGPAGTGTGTCNLNGVVGLVPYALAPVGVNFAYTIQPAACGLIGMAYGAFTAPLGTNFAWQWIGPNGNVTMSSGTVVGVSQSVVVVGSLCAPTAETVVFELAGI